MPRTVVIGDVHGCAVELDELLALIAVGADDRVLFVGDLVARGPATREVLRLFREVGARGTLGNHEGRMLDVRAARRDGRAPPRLSAGHERLYEEFDDEDWATLGSLALWIDLPEHDLRVVHAGFVPGVAMERQDRWALLHMRSFDAAGSPSDRPGIEHWAEAYRGRPHVAFGHDARRGLQLCVDATGLDSACVYGERLSALVLDAGAEVPPPAARMDVIRSVPARRRYFAVSDGRPER